MPERTFKVSADVGMVFIKGRKDVLRVVKPAVKDQIWFLRLENAQITNLSLIFEISCADKCSKQRKQGFETAGKAQETSG